MKHIYHFSVISEKSGRMKTIEFRCDHEPVSYSYYDSERGEECGLQICLPAARSWGDEFFLSSQIFHPDKREMVCYIQDCRMPENEFDSLDLKEAFIDYGWCLDTDPE